MKFLDEVLFTVVGLSPLWIGCLHALVAVLGKASGRFPYLPEERRSFRRPLLPRAHLRCFTTITKLAPRKKRPRRRPSLKE